jgi:hypothetical protein
MSVALGQNFVWDINLPLSWSWMSAVREMVSSGLANHDEHLREEVAMVASELAENVVKYGEPVENAAAGSLQLVITENAVRVVSTNGVRSPERTRRLSETLKHIREQDPRTLYLARMKELMANPGQSESRLGLLRIAFEGQFRLTHSYAGDVLTITAERPLPGSTVAPPGRG